MFTKYHNFFLSNRFFLNSPFQNKQTKPIRLQISLPCISCRSFVCLRIHSFIPSFIHASMHSFIQVPGYTLHIKFLCQNFLQHNVVAWLDQLSWFRLVTIVSISIPLWRRFWSFGCVDGRIAGVGANPVLSLPLFLSSLFLSFRRLIT